MLAKLFFRCNAAATRVSRLLLLVCSPIVPHGLLPERPIRSFATLARSVRLLRSFSAEQSDPPRFYLPLAEDTVSLLELWGAQSPARILDIGGGPGFFAEVFTQHGYQYVSVEPQGGHAQCGAAVRASGMELPFADNSFDIVLSSNVAEHVAEPWTMAQEMLRVTKPGGIMFLSYTVWLGPFGGHETGLWHYCGGKRAARRYYRRNGRWPKNNFGSTLFRVDAAAGVRWARSQDPHYAQLVTVFPRYHPWWAWSVVHIPGIRELLTSNLTIVIHKR